MEKVNASTVSSAQAIEQLKLAAINRRIELDRQDLKQQIKHVEELKELRNYGQVDIEV
jgi:hypothetical protein